MTDRVPSETRIVVDFGAPHERRTSWGLFCADTLLGIEADELLEIEHALFHGLVYKGGVGAAPTFSPTFTVERA